MEGIAIIRSAEYGFQVWALGSTNVRKDHICVLCVRRVKAGTEKMYRPLTNRGNRMDRICEKCVSNFNLKGGE